MRHHMDDPDPHQRRQPDRRAAIVGKGQKCAAVGDKAAMQGDAVHRRRHGVLADTVVQINSRERIVTHRLLCLRRVRSE